MQSLIRPNKTETKYLKCDAPKKNGSDVVALHYVAPGLWGSGQKRIVCQSNGIAVWVPAFGEPDKCTYEEIFEEQYRHAYDAYNKILVDRFLMSWPNIRVQLPYLVEAIGQVFAYEGVRFEVLDNPEAPDCPKLLVLISVDGKPEEALEKLRQFDKQWWLANRARFAGKVSVDIRFS